MLLLLLLWLSFWLVSPFYYYYLQYLYQMCLTFGFNDNLCKKPQVCCSPALGQFFSGNNAINIY